MKKMFKSAIITGAAGLIMILSVIVSNSSYPDMFFTIVTPLGLMLVFIGVVLFAVSWLLYIKDAIRKKKYIWAAVVAALGLAVIVKEIIRYL